MATTYTYHDAYLAKFCTEEREARAVAAVALLGTFAADWTERLVVAQTYVIACEENQAATDDLFTAKLKTYRASLEALLPQARAAAAEAANTVSLVGFFTIPMERA